MIRTMSMAGRTSVRQGFTLIELLVSTGVFLIGFTAAYGLFLAAMRYRTLADDTIKLSLASSSLVEELAIGNPSPFQTALAPSDYVGSGNLPLSQLIVGGGNGSPPPTYGLFKYTGVPGTWFCVERCTDVLGDVSNSSSPTLHLSLFVLVDTQGVEDINGVLDLADLNRRKRILDPPRGNDWRAAITDADDRKDLFDGLIRRGLASRLTAVVLRRPSWM